MDIVYPLGNGSLWKNRELLYSIRSIKKFLTGYDRIFIIGDDPGFDHGCIHLWAADKNGVNKDKNIFDKILLACSEEQISSNFLMMNDDHFLTAPADINTFPFYYNGSLQELKAGTPDQEYYKCTLRNTIRALKKRNLPTKNFDVHVPIVYNKKKFTNIVSSFDWSVEWGYGIKSLYCNSLKIDGEPVQDCKIKEWLTTSQIEEKIKEKPCFSIADSALTHEMRNFLATSYP